jgi:hypothetical protein
MGLATLLVSSAFQRLENRNFIEIVRNGATILPGFFSRHGNLIPETLGVRAEADVVVNLVPEPRDIAFTS